MRMMNGKTRGSSWYHRKRISSPVIEARKSFKPILACKESVASEKADFHHWKLYCVKVRTLTGRGGIIRLGLLIFTRLTITKHTVCLSVYNSPFWHKSSQKAGASSPLFTAFPDLLEQSLAHSRCWTNVHLVGAEQMFTFSVSFQGESSKGTWPPDLSLFSRPSAPWS